MAKYNLNSVIASLSKDIIITTLVFIVIIFAIWSAVFFEFKLNKEELVHNQLDSIVNIYQTYLSEKLSIVASSEAFQDYLQIGDNTQNDQYYRFLDELVTLKDQSIVGTSIYYIPSPYIRGMEADETKLIFSYGKKTPYSVTLKVCYLNRRLDANLGLCQNTWTLYFSKAALLNILKANSRDLIVCKDNCHTINLLPQHSLGSFPVLRASTMKVHLNWKQETITPLVFLIVFFTILLVILLSLINGMRIRQVFNQVIANPLAHIVARLKKGQLPRTVNYIEELEFLSDRIKKAYKAMDKIEIAKIARQAAHDLRSPILAIESVLKKTNKPDEEQLYVIKHSVQQIHDIVNNLVQKNVKDAAINASNFRSVMLTPIISYAISEKHSELEEGDHHPIQLVTKIDESTYKTFVKIVPETFRRILSNVLNNSIDALKNKKSGLITLSIQCEWPDVVIEIHDNGAGIKKHHLSTVFDDGVTYKQGTGLGLFHAKENIEQWGGNITIDSQLNQGTTVTIRLQAQPPAVWFAESMTILSDSKIIVIDDSDTFHHEWKQRLLKLGVAEEAITHFYNPDEFLNWYKARPQDGRDRNVYLVDQEFTGNEKTGLKLIEHMNKDSQCFLVTTYGENFDIQNACEQLNVKLIPKQYVFYMPIYVVDQLADIVLLTKDQWLGKAWEYRVKRLGKTIQCYNSISNFTTDLRLYPLNTPIFIVREFDSIVLKAFALGYNDITVLTHDIKNYTPIEGVKVAQKEFDFDTLTQDKGKTE
ncbi:MAG: hypothetical protein COV52_01680 [Gammaproteobacteria bacterium CG11_big_fil_rev_8_21_14_0_20_46_22]|nr:MAG: hypothetical protein COW05_05575 [Gammaproteobacteria bacterium CG12_big_fil_rev_8_21_14_0_65_46_12]PIR11824.1 MAG: hypothetical protein COV52_01680 [Gammaproteobacteria bacterium CG11_big_fil_rev_8_21_14_0_20_46_22]